MIKVLHYVGSLDYGGVQSFLLELYNKIDKTKVHFDFVIYSEEFGEIHKKLIQLDCVLYECPRYCGINQLSFSKWWKKFYNTHKNEYQILHVHNPVSAWAPMFFAKKNGIRIISHSHSTSNGRGLIALLKNILMLPHRFYPDFMYGCSDQAGIFLFGKRNFKTNHYRTFPNVIDCQRFRFDIVVRNKIRKDLGYENNLVIGNVGRLTEVKNIPFLVDVFFEIFKQRKDARLLLVGNGNTKKSIAERVIKYGLTDYVFFAGAQSNTQDYYNSMDIFVMPSLWEGFGITALEAQANGLPCVITDSKSVSQEVKLTNKVHFIPLEYGSKKWADAIINISNQNYRNESDKEISIIQKRGYDSLQSVSKIYDDYFSCVN